MTGIMIVTAIETGSDTADTIAMMIAILSAGTGGRQDGLRVKRPAGETAMCLQVRRRNMAATPMAARITIPKDEANNIADYRKGRSPERPFFVLLRLLVLFVGIISDISVIFSWNLKGRYIQTTG
jgi:hypothetical protein